VLNVGHGVPQGAPERGVALFCETARASGELFARRAERAAQNGAVAAGGGAAGGGEGAREAAAVAAA
jgi:hypothetical protein